MAAAAENSFRQATDAAAAASLHQKSNVFKIWAFMQSPFLRPHA